MFEVPLLDAHDAPFSPRQLERLIRACVEQSGTPVEHPLGICTTLPRADWAHMYKNLKGNCVLALLAAPPTQATFHSVRPLCRVIRECTHARVTRARTIRAVHRRAGLTTAR